MFFLFERMSLRWEYRNQDYEIVDDFGSFSQKENINRFCKEIINKRSKNLNPIIICIYTTKVLLYAHKCGVLDKVLNKLKKRSQLNPLYCSFLVSCILRENYGLEIEEYFGLKYSFK